MKKIISILLSAMILMMSFMTFASCKPVAKNAENTGSVGDNGRVENTEKSDNSTIQIWWYDFKDSEAYTNAIKAMILKLEIYCKDKDIPIEVVHYGESTLAYEDYILKRNTAMANGNMIIIEEARMLHDISNSHADYSKLANYNNLIDAYKDRFCIPIGVGYRAIHINNEAIKHYGISMESNVLTDYEYLDIIQEMKEKGAKFTLSQRVISNIVDYYMMKNNIRYLSSDSKILENKDKFKAAIKKTLIDVYEDFKTYYKDENYNDSFLEKIYDRSNLVYDEASELAILGSNEYNAHNFYLLSEADGFSALKDNIIGKSFVFDDNITLYSPCVYINKKITNNKIYDVVNEMLTDVYFKSINTVGKTYSPAIDTENIRKYFGVDENWENNGFLKTLAEKGKEQDVVTLNTVNDAYRMMVKDKDKTKHIADAYLSNRSIYFSISGQIKELINKEIVNSGFDYTKKEIDDMINKQLDDFILDFYLYYK